MIKRIALRLPVELHRTLVEMAKRNQRSLHAQIMFILWEYIKSND